MWSQVRLSRNRPKAHIQVGPLGKFENKLGRIGNGLKTTHAFRRDDSQTMAQSVVYLLLEGAIFECL